VAVADYEAWDRRFRPLDGSAEFSYSRRVSPACPTIHVYDADGKALRRVGPEAFREPFWCDLAFTGDGRRLLISPHNWTSRGLGGQPILPADAGARDLYILDPASGDIGIVRFPDAIASVAGAADGGIIVGCWDRRVYFLDEKGRPVARLPKGLDVGAASLVRTSRDGARVAVATTAGAVLMLDAKGQEVWRTDLNQAAKPGDRSWTKNVQADKIAPGLWRTSGNRAHSDLGSQILIEAPQGLLLIDPNAGASFEQNWARIQAAGLDPMQLKYVLLTHEHGDHAPGAYLWRIFTGAQVVASAEMAYTLRHHIPAGTGYGLHPPQPVDLVLTGDRELDLAGLKVKAIRLPGHTYGSLGYVFAKDGKTYAATGDLVMGEGVLGYSGSIDFSARDVLASLRKLAALRPDVVLGGHGSGNPDNFIAKGIEAGEATGWSRMTPEKPNPLYRFTQTNYLVAAWLQPMLGAAFGDIDGDGRPDVAVLVPKGQGAAVRVHLNKEGKFAEAPDAEIDLPDLGRGWKLGLVHLGKNKTADLVASSEGQTMVLLSQPEPLKFRVVPIPGTIRAAQFLTGDFSGKGRTDLLVGSRFVGAFGIASQAEDGTFRLRQAKPLAKGYFDIALADVNGDKREDLLLSNGDGFLRQPDGSLAETPSFHFNTPQGTDAGWTFMGAGDFDGDGWPDVAFITNVKDGALVWLYRNTRNPQEPFAKEPSATFMVPGAVVGRDGPTVGDWNGDGAADLILGAQDKRGARILTGSPQDGLSAQRVISLPLDYEPFYDAKLVVADFNGDGRPDLAGFGPSAVGAVGVYIWLRPPDKDK
jgi:glyoxylase-like metal-dependent hydrolase (beta-lactamase superfamily II)